MSPATVYLVLAAAAGLVCVSAIAWWIASRTRIASEIVGRADDHARQLRAQAERDAETVKKEAQLEARERSHLLLADAEKKARRQSTAICGRATPPSPSSRNARKRPPSGPSRSWPTASGSCSASPDSPPTKPANCS